MILILAVFLTAGCTVRQTSQPLEQTPVVHNIINDRSEKQVLYARGIMEAADKRNQDIERNPYWIEWAYSKLGIKKINDIPHDKYSYYSKFLDNGNVYIIVHPSYYVFFHNKKPVINRTPENLGFNIVDIFVNENYENPVIKIVQKQQKNERNFIEYITTEGKLLILVLPRNYQNHPSYAYSSEMDEYARYINEITNGFESALYIESDSPTSGKLLVNDLVMLLSFLGRAGAKSVLIGGGYVGRCQEEFYNYLSNYSFAYNYFIVPEISSFSPADISEKAAPKFLDDEKINLQAASQYVLSKTAGITNLQHLSSAYADTVLSISLADPAEENGVGDVAKKDNQPQQGKKPVEQKDDQIPPKEEK
ncbi:MAG: hypothetical protein AB1632_06670 [Nitrospirota bacterium]